MEAMGIIFSNIYDSSMGELTRERTSASIPFGSRYRQIDFALSNMANSKISNIGIVTKYNYQSLMDHLGNCEEWDLKLGEGVRFLPPGMPPVIPGHTAVSLRRFRPPCRFSAAATLSMSCCPIQLSSAQSILQRSSKSILLPAVISQSSPKQAAPTARHVSRWLLSLETTVRLSIWLLTIVRRRTIWSA